MAEIEGWICVISELVFHDLIIGSLSPNKPPLFQRFLYLSHSLSLEASVSSQRFISTLDLFDSDSTTSSIFNMSCVVTWCCHSSTSQKKKKKKKKSTFEGKQTQEKDLCSSSTNNSKNLNIYQPINQTMHETDSFKGWVIQVAVLLIILSP
ncbi:hypothetical protein Scep_030192 [Stephania cephalantha]|uniref:Uncharacterized protein n=1 Tax=Stephania cephalantha TaxID=152367 RepID=A0AAP0DZB4_9MAGN